MRFLKCFEDNNYFHSEERAKEVADKIKFLLKLERLHDMLCPDYTPVWDSCYEKKFYIYFNNINGKYEYSYLQSIRTAIDVYFPTEVIAQRAVDMLNNGEI